MKGDFYQLHHHGWVGAGHQELHVLNVSQVGGVIGYIGHHHHHEWVVAGHQEFYELHVCQVGQVIGYIGHHHHHEWVGAGHQELQVLHAIAALPTVVSGNFTN